MRRRPLHSLSIRARLVLLALAGSLPLAIFAGVMASRLIERQYAATQNEIFERVRLLSNAIDQALFDIESNLRILATSPTLKAGNLAAFYEHAMAAARLSAGTAIVLVDRSGKFVINTVGPFGAPQQRRQNRATEDRVFTTGKPQVSNVFTAVVQQQPTVSVEVPVTFGDTVQYVLAMGVRPSYFLNLLEQQQLPADWRVALLDRDGRVITQSFNPTAAIGHRATGSFAGLNQLRVGRWLARVTRDGIPVYVSFTTSERSGWMVAAAVPRAVIDAPYWQAVGSVAAVGASVIALSVLAALLAAGTITRPLTKVAQAAEAIGRGAPPRIDLGGTREFDSVQRALLKAGAERDRALHQLEHTAQTLTAILGTTEDPIYLFDAQKRYRYVSAAGLRAIARSEEEVIGKTWQEVGLPAEVMAPVERMLDEVISTGRSVVAETEYPPGAFWEFRLDAMRGGNGAIRGIVASSRNITAHRQAENALRASEARLQTERALLEAVVRSMPVGVLVVEAQTGRFLFANDILTQLWGRPLADWGEWCGLVGGRQLRPDGIQYPPDELPIARSLRQGEVVFNEETTYRKPSGSELTLVVNSAPVRDAQGRIIAAVAAIFDITERKQAMDRQKLLLDEINHRSKNTMATIQSIAYLSLRSATSLQEFGAAFQARLASLAQAHDVLTRHRWQGATIDEVLGAALAPYYEEKRIAIRGEEVHVSAKVALALTVAAHELGTNSAKYGALSVPTGRVEADWQVIDEAGGPTVVMTWSEHGGPPVQAPSRRGFGTRFIETALAREVDGRVTLDFAATGVRCRIEFALRAQQSLGAVA